MSVPFPVPDVYAVVVTDGKHSNLMLPSEAGEQTLSGLRSYARSLAKRNPDYQVHIVRFKADSTLEEQ
jgi:hypothetical protein